MHALHKSKYLWMQKYFYYTMKNIAWNQTLVVRLSKVCSSNKRSFLLYDCTYKENENSTKFYKY